MGFTDSERMAMDVLAARGREPFAIDPRDYGRLEAKVDALEDQVTELQQDVKTLLELANKGRGGFWVGMSIASAIGGLVTWLGGLLLNR